MENSRERGRDRDKDDGFVEHLVKLNRVSKVVKGGKHPSFAALVVVGDQKGHVGYGFGKSNDVTEAIHKATARARAHLVTVPVKNEMPIIPHEIIGSYKSARVLLRPAVPGTGIIAGGPVRYICDAAGIKDVLSKSLGSRNPINSVKAAFDALENLFDGKTVAKNRGKKSLAELWG